MHFTNSTFFFLKNPASIYSSTFSGNGAVAEYAYTGSPPRATATGIRLSSFLYSLKCLAETLCLCQCIPVSVGSKTCILYIPTFLIPVFGSFVCITGNVTKGPPSLGQHVITGSFVISGSRITISWHSPFPFFTVGIHEANWFSFGSIFNLSSIPSFGADNNLKRFSISLATLSKC